MCERYGCCVVADGVVGVAQVAHGVRLTREYLEASVAPYIYIAVLTGSPERPGELGGAELKAFEALANENRNIVLSTCRYVPLSHYGLRCTILPFGVWRRGEMGLAPTELHVFNASDAIDVDMLAWCGTCPARRNQLRAWGQAESGIEGCSRLVGGAVLSPPFGLYDKRIPVLTLLDALHGKGYVGQDSLMFHSEDSDLVYHSR